MGPTRISSSSITRNRQPSDAFRERLSPLPLIAALLWICSTVAAQVTETRLVPRDVAADDFHGNAVAIHGTTAVVASYRDDDRGRDAGSVYVHEQRGGTWSQTAKLTAADGTAGDLFGSAVAIHGGTIVVGSEGDATRGPSTGTAYVFERRGTQWVQAATLLPADLEANDRFGFSIAVHDSTVVVSAMGRDRVTGVAYVFERRDGAWTQSAVLAAADGAPNDFFGHFVAMHGDTLLVGSPADDDAGTDSGSVYVFARGFGGTWTQTAKLTASDGAAADFLGRVGSIHGDTFVVGARENDDRGASSGSAYVFQHGNGAWVEVAKLLASDGLTGDVFGHSVGISGDRIAVGAKWRDDTQFESGAVYLFERFASSWRQVARINATDPGSGDALGQSLAVDGRSFLAGAWRRAGTRGAAYLFQLPSTVDPDVSAVTASASIISTFGGRTEIVVRPLAVDGSVVGAGLDSTLR